MTHYGTLRTWATLLKLVGVVGMLLAAVGAVIWAFEVEGFWATVGVILIGTPLVIFVATWPIALGQALIAIADIGDVVKS